MRVADMTSLTFVTLVVMMGGAEGVKVAPIDFGVIHYENGIVITRLEVIPKIVVLQFPKYATLLPEIFGNITMPDSMKLKMLDHGRRLGAKFDAHTKSSLSIWYQERTNKPIRIDEIQMYWNEKIPGRTKRFIDITGMGVYASIVSTAAMGLAINNKVEIDKLKGQIAGLKEFAKITRTTLDNVGDSVNANKDNIKIILNKLNAIEDYQQSLFDILTLLTDLSIGFSLFESTLDQELEHLKSGRLPTKLLNADLLTQITRLATNQGMSIPLRLIKTTVLENNPNHLSIVIQIEVPVMSTLIYYPKYKVENTHTPIGYLVNFMREISIIERNELKWRLDRSKFTYHIVLERSEVMTVDGNPASSDISVSHSEMDFSILVQNVSRSITDYSENIKRMESAQSALNNSLIELGKHPVITGNTMDWLKSLDIWMIISSILITLFAMIFLAAIVYVCVKARRPNIQNMQNYPQQQPFAPPLAAIMNRPFQMAGY